MNPQPHIAMPGGPLLETKFHIPEPEADTVIRRHALLAGMTDALHHQLILIQAPAGSGKTTLLAQWIEEQKLGDSVTWVSLDRQDNHPGTFWAYVISGLNQIIAHVCDPALELLASGQSPGSGDLLITLVNGIKRAGRRVVLVLDDFHLIQNPDILDGINFLLDHPADTLTLVLSSRITPQMGLARLRVQGRLKEITETDLAFSRQEVTAFSRRFTQPALAPAALEVLHQKTEGWAAALKLAMLTRAGSPHFSVDRLSGSTGFVRDYLMEEVWSGFSRDMQAAVRRISVLNRFNPVLCRALSPETRDLNPIAFMDQRRLFLVPLDNTGHWYRFHHLFQEFLLKQLEREEDPRIFHQRAAVWFDTHQYVEEAFFHALEARRPDLAARILGAHTPAIFGKGADHALVPFLRQLPLSAVQGHPVLASYHYTIETYNGHFNVLEEMAACCSRAETHEDRQVLEGFYAAQKGYDMIYRSGALEEAILKIRRAQALIPGEHLAMRRLLELMVSFCHRFLGNARAAQAFLRPRPGDGLPMSAMIAISRIDLGLEMGNLKAARKLAQKEISAVESAFQDNIPAIYGFLFIIRGVIAREENQMETAGRFFARGIAIGRDTRLLELAILSLGEYARFLCDTRRFDQAHDIIDQAIALAIQSPWIQSMMMAIKQWIWLSEGKTDLISDWAAQYPVDPAGLIPFHKTLEYLVLVRYLMKVREWRRALGILDPMIRANEEHRRNGWLMTCYLLRARLLYLSGKSQMALGSLSRAVEISRNQGYVRCFLSELAGVEGLVKLAMAELSFPAHVADPLKSTVLSGGPAPAHQVTIHDYPENFNTRELAILKLFCKGRSNQETADELSLSVNTIRWYASRIFAKLGAKRRGQAVSRARELGLI